MVPGQSTGELSQPSQAMRAGEDEERGRGSSSSRLPAAAGKGAAGAGCQLLASSSSSCPHASCSGLGQNKAKALSGHPFSMSKTEEGNIGVRKGTASLNFE